MYALFIELLKNNHIYIWKKVREHLLYDEGKLGTRARFHEQRFPPKSLPKLHALQSTVTIFHGIITVSQYR